MSGTIVLRKHVSPRRKMFKAVPCGIGPGYCIEVKTGPRHFIQFGRYPKGQATSLAAAFNRSYKTIVKE